MYNVVITDEVKQYIKEIKKTLKDKGYINKKSTNTLRLGTYKIVNKIDYFIKNRIMFELNVDGNTNEINVYFHYIENGNKHFKKIMLGEILELC